MTNEQILDIPMGDNDAGAATIRDYLIKLLRTLWSEEEGFSGKRPFGNSGWQQEVMVAMVRAGAIKGSFDEYGFLDSFDRIGGDWAILAAIDSLGIKEN